MTNKWSKTKLLRLGLRIAAVVSSIISGIKTATASQTVQDCSTVTSSDYPSFQYASVADLASAVLQGVVIYLEVMGAKKSSKLLVGMIDKIVVALTSTSTALLFAVDEITSCGLGRRSVCSQAREFCSGIRLASLVSLGGTVSVASAVYIRRAPEALTLVRELFNPVIHQDVGPVIPPTSPRISPPNPWPPTSPKPNSDSEKSTKNSDNLELLITAPPGPCPCHPPTGWRLSVSSHYDYEDEDAESGRDDSFH